MDGESSFSASSHTEAMASCTHSLIDSASASASASVAAVPYPSEDSKVWEIYESRPLISQMLHKKVCVELMTGSVRFERVKTEPLKNFQT